MRKLVDFGLIVLVVMVIVTVAAQAELVSHLGITTSVPVAKVVQSRGANAWVDVVPFIGFGGGPSLSWIDNKDVTETKKYSLNLGLDVTNRENDAKKLDFTLVLDFGMFNNTVRIGAGMYLGKQVEDVSRLIGVFSIGTNLFQ